MDISDRRALKDTAENRLSQASYSPRKLMLIHTGVSLGFSLLLTLLNFVISQQIDSTGGLSGVSTRSMLNTIQYVLELAGSILLPFWEVGIVYAAIRWVRGKTAEPKSLTEGFHRFGSVLGLMLLRGLILIAVAVVCMYVSSWIYMLTPFSDPLVEIMESVMADTTILTESYVMDDATLTAATDAMVPMLVIWAVLTCVVAIPLTYRMRMADYLILDDERIGAGKAISRSFKLTKKKCFQLFRLDLSFWWFYLLEGLFLLVGCADVMLPALGVSLPMGSDTAFFVFYVVQILCQIALYWWKGAQVKATYAVAYDTLLNEPEVIVQKEPPKAFPWENAEKQ